MDANKAVKLREIGYAINGTCGICKHALFNNPASFWGECQVYKYDHLKHSDGKRHLSISAFGKCDRFELNEEWETKLHGFKEFIKK